MSIQSRTKDGKKQWQYRCYYKTLGGVTKQKNSKWYDTKKEAKEAEATFIQMKNQSSASSVTFHEVTLKWMEFNKRQLKPSTVYSKYTYLRMMEPFNEKKIQNITSKDIDNFFDLTRVSTYKYSTKKTLLTNLKTIFKFARKQYGIDNDPFLKMTPLKKPVERQAKQLELLSKEDFKTLYKHLETTRNGIWKETANIIWLLYFTGMRASECLSLTFDDFDGKSVYVNKQFIHGQWQTPKTPNSIRKIALDKQSINLINEQYDKYKDMPSFNKGWFIFNGYSQLNQEVLRNRKNIACRECGIPEFKIHSLRHSHASNLIESGVNMFKISKRLGHSSIEITMDTYGHLLDTDEDEILQAIEKDR